MHYITLLKRILARSSIHLKRLLLVVSSSRRITILCIAQTNILNANRILLFILRRHLTGPLEGFLPIIRLDWGDVLGFVRADSLDWDLVVYLRWWRLFSDARSADATFINYELLRHRGIERHVLIELLRRPQKLLLTESLHLFIITRDLLGARQASVAPLLWRELPLLQHLPLALLGNALQVRDVRSYQVVHVKFILLDLLFNVF